MIFDLRLKCVVIPHPTLPPQSLVQDILILQIADIREELRMTTCAIVTLNVMYPARNDSLIELDDGLPILNSSA